MNIEIINGVVTNDGETIGSIQGDVCTTPQKLSGPVKGAIRKEMGNPELAFEVSGDILVEAGSKAEGSGSAPLKLDALSDDDLAAEMLRRGLIKNEPETSAIVQPPVKQVDLSAVERLNNLAKEGKIPHPPAKHPAMGDKDPAYVAWFKAHATPEEIAIRYPARRRVPASAAEFAKAEERLKGKLPGEKKDTNKENDFSDSAE